MSHARMTGSERRNSLPLQARAPACGGGEGRGRQRSGGLALPRAPRRGRQGRLRRRRWGGRGRTVARRQGRAQGRRRGRAQGRRTRRGCDVSD